ncbi:MAG: phosphoenolpyruvate--protein phosphotransferase [Planctomycetes bacterium]|nr:phosphoenolpyruvate--protein phosphotransferase [Planctomycetota bacterium]
MEIIRKGIPVSSGFAIGEAIVLDTEEFRIPQRTVAPEEVEPEVVRLQRAVEASRREFEGHLTRLSKKTSGIAQILQAHLGLLTDPQLADDLISTIRKNRFTAEYSVSRTLKKKIKVLQDSGSSVFQAVIRDFSEIEKALIRQLLGAKREDISRLTKKVVVVAHDLTPAQTLAFDREKVLGMVTEVGGRTSHTAIVAASFGIPAVVGVEGVTTAVSGGDTIILDGTGGTVIVNPSEATLKRYQAMERNYVLLGRRLERELRDLPAETRDGHRAEILANIELPGEVAAAIEHGAEGVGLYRTEYLYLQNGFNPTEPVQIDAYRQAVQLVGGRKLVIRTLDLGADKMPLDSFPREDNPFLGTRAVRLCLERRDIFRTQLRAILKTASMGQVHVMIPMISSLHEVIEVREFVDEVRRELQREGESIPSKVPIGIMVEVPSTAIVADLMADHVDFFSIGTNDLIAYSIAVDRLNERVASLYQPSHPAILRLLRHVIQVGEARGKPVSVCGEMSSDPVYTILLLGLGLKCFSVVPPAIPEIKKIVRSVTMEEARAVAGKAFEFSDARKTEEFLRSETRKIIPDAL